MNKALSPVPKADKVETGVSNVPDIAEGLQRALADTYRLMFKTHAYHWNVEGPLFHPVHVLTEGQYADLFKAADVVAERIRALGFLAPWQLADIMRDSLVEDAAKLPAAQEMVADLATDHAAVAKRLREVIEVAEQGNDPVTADLLTGRCAFHEKAAWMLRATAK